MAKKLVKMGIPKTAIYETKLVSPAKAEKLGGRSVTAQRCRSPLVR